MSRSTIPPSSLPPGSPGQETLEVLQRRLVMAEDDTKHLVDTLSQMGFSQELPNNRLGKHDAVKPFQARVAEPDVLHKHYDALVSRVCKTESAIQTLKMSLLQAQAERDFSKQEKASANEKLSFATEAYEKEIKKLNRELSLAKKDYTDAMEMGRKLEQQVSKLQQALEESGCSKTQVTVESEDLRASKQKLMRRVSELKDELAREGSLRQSLEESHNVLLARVQEMEGLVETERGELRTLGTTCSGLKSESLKAKEISKKEHLLRVQLEQRLIETQTAKDSLQSKLKSSEEDKRLMMSEMKKMQTGYLSLNHQLDEMRKLIEDRQSTTVQLEKENKQLCETVKSSAAQNAKLVSKYEQELESEKANTLTKTATEETIKELQAQLRESIQAKTLAEQQCKLLESKVSNLEEEVTSKKEELKSVAADVTKEIAKLNKQIETLGDQKEKALKEKEALLDEVNQAVDGMTEERTQLEAELQGAKIEIQTLQQAKKQLEQEQARLYSKINGMEDQQSAAKQIETTMAGMMEQKNKLAYDKGRLQDRVEQLQRELETMATTQGDLNQLRKVSSALEAKYTKATAEVNNYKMCVQRLESQLAQSETGGERREKDFQMAIKSRDEAVREAQKLLGHIEALEEQTQQKVKGYENNIGEARMDNKKIACTLESVMSSHSQLQATVEGLQIELGKKDSKLSQLKNDKEDLERKLKQSVREYDGLQAKISAMEDLETSELQPLRRSLQKCKDDNVKMAASMEMLLTSNSQLQGSLQSLQDELEKKQHLVEKIQQAREKDQESQKQELHTYEERLENLKLQLMRERDKTIKKSSRDVAEVRKQLEETLSKNGDLSRANSDLRHKVTELEYHQKELKEKISGLKSQIEHLTKIRQKQEQQLDSMQNVTEQLSRLEQTKTQYIRKSKEQSKTIENFMSQIASLQGEIQTLAKAHLDSSAIVQSQEEQLEKERRFAEAIKLKYKKAKQREEHLEKLRHQTEEKLKEANNESMQISSNLQDAHEWFKSKFEKLQGELGKSRQTQAEIEQENFETRRLLTDEKKRAEETADRAKAMIRASRETISRLADFAQLSQKQATQQLRDMKYQVEHERGKSEYSKKKFQDFQDSSLRMTEELARELEAVKTRSSTYYDSGDSFTYS